MMYVIYLGSDNKYHCEGRLQDSTERWVENSLEEAVKSLKQFAKFGNGMKIKRKDIAYFVAKEVVKQEYIETPIPKKRS